VAFGTHLWQTTLVLLGVLILGRLLRSAPARLLHLVWTLAFAKLLLPLAIVGGAMDWIFARLGIHADTGRALGAFGPYIGGVLDPVAMLGAPSSPAAVLAPWIAAVLTAAWLAGAGWMILRLLGSWRAAQDLSIQPISSLPAHLLERVERAALRAEVAPGALAVSDAVAVPAVIGLVSPRIVIPPWVIERLDETELRSILLHEEHHRRRRDPLRDAITTLVASLYSFHPLVAQVRRRMQESVELLCDGNVVRAGLEPGVYARALAKVVSATLGPSRPALASSVDRGSGLGNRMERLDQPWRFNMKARHYLGFALLVCLLGAGTLAPVSWIAGCSREQPAADRGVPMQSQDTSPAAEETQPDTMPVLIEMPPPAYPDQARLDGLEGTVMVRTRIDGEGNVAEAFVIEGAEVLSGPALESVRAARFRPAMKDGLPVPVWVQLPIRFALK
jgi:TonB family protein